MLARFEPPPLVLIRVGRAVTPNEAADVLAALYPALLRFAERQLRDRHLDYQLAEDLVQEAVVSWFSAHGQFRTTAEFSAYLRLAIVNRAKNLQGRREDALDREPLSLDAQIEEA